MKSEHLESGIGHVFKDRILLQTALTHASVQKGVADNERLEFLGDRILGLVIADMLYRSFPQEKEGALAKRHAALVQRRALAAVAERIGLGDFIRVSSGEMKSGGTQRETILADALEALIGAVYLDGGYGEASAFVMRFWASMLGQNAEPPEDPKTRLQEWAQARGFSLPVYRVISQSGSAHAPAFEIEVVVDTAGTAIGAASSKREAEKDAARKMLEQIGL